ncbi:uncharacterized protein PV09_08157 [Verruconis gallopava]|uniref:Uncharacterized protein n=1 Tax=Verruconis gallopava TaxID=253628 RepID=A0A0D1YHE8_9PEZI|nr:uncharacterized protein PV09_08157 [Verruconis gallopava]KIW00267.1 hypothetical protein PV09_08157 [Verruconis gallopava]
MDSFAFNDASFGLGKHYGFADEVTTQALQTSSENVTSPLTSSDTATFNYNVFFGEDAFKDGSYNTSETKIEKDQPLKSIEDEIEAAASVATSGDQNDRGHSTTAVTTSLSGCDETQSSSVTAIFSESGMKDGSIDTTMYIPTGIEAIFEEKSYIETELEDVGGFPQLDGPFLQPNQQLNGMPGTITQIQQKLFHSVTPESTSHLQLPEMAYNRRRSQTVPPEFDSGTYFQRPTCTGRNISQGRYSQRPFGQSVSSLPNQNVVFSNRINRRFPDDPIQTSAPRSHPVTSPPCQTASTTVQQEFIPTASRPQSLDPEVRLSLLRRTRDMSPDRSRKIKRQKQNRTIIPPAVHTYVQSLSPNVDMASYGINQAMTAVEFLLRDMAEKIKYAKDEEIEKERSQARAFNSTITSVKTPLASMASKRSPPFEVPKTGEEIRELNTQRIQALLDFFDIPFVTTMFLHDKKLLYLNFLGANGTLKHLVLD